MATLVKRAIRSAAGWASMSAPEQAEYDNIYYESITLWIATLPSDLVVSDETHHAVIYKDDFGDGVGVLNESILLSGHTTNSTHQIIIEPHISAYHNFVIGGGIVITAFKNYGDVVDIVDQNVLLKGVEICNTGTSSNRCIAIDSNSRASHIIISDGASGFSAGNGSIVSWSLALNQVATGFINVNWQSPEFYNNLSVGCGIGFGSSDNTAAILKNNVAYDCTADYALTQVHADSTNNATSASTLDASLGTITDVAISDFIDAANDDYHLSVTSKLKDAGLNLIESGDLLSPQHDIDYEQLPGVGSWHIGPDHSALTFTAVGAGSLGAIVGTGAATHTRPVFTAVGEGSLGAIIGTGTATHTHPVFTAVGAGSLSAITGAGTATHTRPVFTAVGAGVLPTITGSATNVVVVGVDLRDIQINWVNKKQYMRLL